MTTDIIDRIAESQAKFDGRTLIAMPAGERERYRERARLAVEEMTSQLTISDEMVNAWKFAFHDSFDAWKDAETYEDHIRKGLQAAIAHLPAAPEPADAWQPIETAPKDGTCVFLWLRAPYSGAEKACWSQKLEQWFTWDEVHAIDKHLPSHWQPLFSPPASAHEEAAGG